MVLFFIFFEGVKIYILKHKFNKGNWNIGMIHCSVQERPRNISVHVLLCFGSRDGWSYVMPHLELTRIDYVLR